MSNRPRPRPRPSRRIRVRGIKRRNIDLNKLSRAVVLLAHSQAEKDAETEHRREVGKSSKRSRS